MKGKRERGWTWLIAVALVVCAPSAVPRAAAQDAELPAPMQLPFSDVAPRVEGTLVRAAALGAPDERIGRFDPRRASARRAGRARALAAIHAWVDDALVALRADPRVAQRAHAAVERHARVEGTRPLLDGGAVVVVTVPLTALREACPMPEAPWAR